MCWEIYLLLEGAWLDKCIGYGIDLGLFANFLLESKAYDEYTIESAKRYNTY